MTVEKPEHKKNNQSNAHVKVNIQLFRNPSSNVSQQIASKQLQFETHSHAEMMFAQTKSQ